MAIKHNFFGLECYIDRELSNYDQLELALNKMGWRYRNINFVSQIHSNNVVVINDENKILPRQNLPQADAIVTNQKNLAICVVTADCAPIIIEDYDNEIIAIIHAGWRGAKKDIIKNAITEMLNLGADIKKMKAFIGPMIHQKSYQVSADFYNDFVMQNNENKIFFKTDLKETEKYLFDLVAFVKRKLNLAEIFDIEDIDIDSYENFDKYASYRKSFHLAKNLDKRNISVAIIE